MKTDRHGRASPDFSAKEGHNLKKIFLALMTYGQHGYRLTVLDFKQCDVAICPEADDQLAQQGIFRRCLAATERKTTQKIESPGNSLAGASCRFCIPLREKVE